MFRFIVPIILIVISVAGFLMFTSPIYKNISMLKQEVSSYNEALDNSKALENERDKLTKKYNAINSDDLIKIQKLLPDNVDNIRLILEIEQVASPYGMQLRDVKYDSLKKNTTAQTADAVQPAETDAASSKEYGTWSLAFSTQGTYENFINFVKDLEKNLRIMDISSIEFSSDTGGINPSLSDTYKYSFKVNTYWLKN